MNDTSRLSSFFPLQKSWITGPLIGGIDLSVGSVVALVTVVTMQIYRLLIARHGASWASLAAVSAGVGIGGLAGLVNGLAITRLRVTPFVATLGMLSIARGLAVW